MLSTRALVQISEGETIVIGAAHDSKATKLLVQLKWVRTFLVRPSTVSSSLCVEGGVVGWSGHSSHPERWDGVLLGLSWTSTCPPIEDQFWYLENLYSTQIYVVRQQTMETRVWNGNSYWDKSHWHSSLTDHSEPGPIMTLDTGILHSPYFVVFRCRRSLQEASSPKCNLVLAYGALPLGPQLWGPSRWGPSALRIFDLCLSTIGWPCHT